MQYVTARNPTFVIFISLRGLENQHAMSSSSSSTNKFPQTSRLSRRRSSSRRNICARVSSAAQAARQRISEGSLICIGPVVLKAIRIRKDFGRRAEGGREREKEETPLILTENPPRSLLFRRDGS